MGARFSYFKQGLRRLLPERCYLELQSRWSRFRYRRFRPSNGAVNLPRLLEVPSDENQARLPPSGTADGRYLRILFAAPWLITGGADTMIVDWFENLDDDWCEKYLVTTLPRENRWLEKIAGHAAGIYDLPAAGCFKPTEICTFLEQVIAAKNIDILHIMNSEAAYHCLPQLKKRFPGLKVVAQFHCFDYLPDGRRTGFAATIPPLYDYLIDCYNLEYPELGREIGASYPEISAAKFKVVHGRIDCDHYDPKRCPPHPEIAARRRPGGLNLLFVGRLDRQKQPLRLLAIARELRQRDIRFFLHVVGAGCLESQQKEFLRGLREPGLADRVCWYGEQPLERLYDWYQIADIMLLTSDWEGVPMVLYQALAMEVVPVAAAVGGCAELVTPECGFLVSDPDNIEGYVAAVCALEDREYRRRLGLAARTRMRRYFSRAGLGPAYKKLYQAL